MNAMYEFEYVEELGHGLEFDLRKNGEVCAVVIYDENGKLISDKRLLAIAYKWAEAYIKSLAKMAKTAFMPNTLTKEWQRWAIQVNANYHDGNMSAAKAEEAAGPEPIKYEAEAVALETAQADRLAAAMLRQAGPTLQAARWNREAVR